MIVNTECFAYLPSSLFILKIDNDKWVDYPSLVNGVVNFSALYSLLSFTKYLTVGKRPKGMFPTVPPALLLTSYSTLHNKLEQSMDSRQVFADLSNVTHR